MTDTDMTKPLAVTMGEPAGIGGELSLKAWLSRRDEGLLPFFVLDDPARLSGIAGCLGLDVPVKPISDLSEAVAAFDEALPVYPVQLPEDAMPGRLNAANAPAVLGSIEKAVQFALDGRVSGIVTNPIHKAVLQDAGFDHPGHTEFLAALCGGSRTPVMMLAAQDLRVVPLTVHIPLKDVSGTVTQDLICEKARIVHKALQTDFGLQTPRLAMAGLNPHAGEGGKIGLEEQEIITPALDLLRADGMHVSGPHSADTMFHGPARAGYDAALCMYHDQALIPLKTLDFYGGVNVTLGLPVVRTSPDHGTALELAGTGQARADSLIVAVRMAGQIAAKRSAS